MSETTGGTYNKPGSGSSGEAQAKANTLSAESDAQSGSGDESDQTAKEAQLDRNVERFFQDKPDYTVVADDFRSALDAQLAYYKQRIAFLAELYGKACRERDEAKNDARSIEAEFAKVGSSANDSENLHQAISTIQSSVKDGSRKLRELSELLPSSVKQGISSSPHRISSSSQVTNDFFGINRLADEVSQFIQTTLKLVQLYSKSQTQPSNSQGELTGQTHNQPDIGEEIKGGKCHQRIKEREFEIERLENRIRLAGGIVTDLLIQSESILNNIETNREEVYEMEDSGRISQEEEFQASPEDDEKLRRYEDLLRQQVLADPDDSTGAAQSLREAIAKRETENAKKAVTTTGGKMERLNKPSHIMKSSIETNKVGVTKIPTAINKEAQVFKEPEAASAAAPMGTEDAAAISKMCSAIVASKNQIIGTLREEVHDAHALNATYLEDIKRLKRDAASEVGDLQKRLTDCLASKRTETLPPVSEPETGGSIGSNNGDDGWSFASDDSGGGYHSMQLPGPQLTGSQSTWPQSHGSPPQLSPSQRSPSLEYPLRVLLQKKKPLKQSSLITLPFKTPRLPPPQSTPQAPRKKRRVGEGENSLKRLIKESNKFRDWPTGTKKLNRPGF